MMLSNMIILIILTRKYYWV